MEQQEDTLAVKKIQINLQGKQSKKQIKLGRTTPYNSNPEQKNWQYFYKLSSYTAIEELVCVM